MVYSQIFLQKFVGMTKDKNTNLGGRKVLLFISFEIKHLQIVSGPTLQFIPIIHNENEGLCQ